MSKTLTSVTASSFRAADNKSIRNPKRVVKDGFDDISLGVTFPRLSIPGNECVQCGAIVDERLVCPGCGWVDPVTRAPKHPVSCTTEAKPE